MDDWHKEDLERAVCKLEHGNWFEYIEAMNKFEFSIYNKKDISSVIPDFLGMLSYQSGYKRADGSNYGRCVSDRVYKFAKSCVRDFFLECDLIFVGYALAADWKGNVASQQFGEVEELLRKRWETEKSKDSSGTAIIYARIMMAISKKKNELASKRDLLLDDIPKLPKKGIIYYRIRGSVRYG